MTAQKNAPTGINHESPDNWPKCIRDGAKALCELADEHSYAAGNAFHVSELVQTGEITASNAYRFGAAIRKGGRFVLAWSEHERMHVTYDRGLFGIGP